MQEESRFFGSGSLFLKKREYTNFQNEICEKGFLIERADIGTMEKTEIIKIVSTKQEEKWNLGKPY